MATPSLAANQPTFSALLIRHRKAVKLTQEHLAERAGVSVVTISALERGVRRAPYRANVAVLAEALSLSGQLLGDFEAAADRSRSRCPRQSAADAAPAHNLPPRPTSFIGRASELAEIARLVSHRRLVTITGSGGIGKTRTALETADLIANRWRDGVWFVDLAPLGEPTEVIGKLASVLGVYPVTEGDPLAGLVATIKSRRLLLILDNCEHLITAVRVTAAAIFHGCPEISILATSRELIRIPGEAVYRIPTLAVPAFSSMLTAAASRAYAAIGLFVERAAAAEWHFEFNDECVECIVDICVQLDGIPLAIELVAAQVPTLGLSALRTRLKNQLNVISTANPDAPRRHKTLLATIAWSYDLLDEKERVLFRRLAIFADGWTLESAEAVCADELLPGLAVLDVLTSLVEKSLVTVEHTKEAARYRLLVSTRAFAQAQLAALEESQLIADRHLAHLGRLFARAGAAYMQTSKLSIVTALRVELEDTRAALKWAATSCQAFLGASLFVATPLWYLCGFHAEELRTAEVLMTLIDQNDGRLTARLLTKLAGALENNGRTARAFEIAKQAVDTARLTEDPAVLAAALGRFGYQAMRARCFDIARVAFDEAETTMDEAERRALPPLVHRAFLLEARGRLDFLRGDFAASAQTYRRLGTLHRSLGNRYAEIIVALQAAEIDHTRGQTAQAISNIYAMLPDVEQFAGRDVHASALTLLAGFLVSIDDAAGATDAASNAIQLVSTSGLPTWTAIALEQIALALSIKGKLEDAARLAGYCDACMQAAATTREFTEQRTKDRLTALLHEHLPSAKCLELLGEGTSMTQSQAIDLALNGIPRDRLVLAPVSGTSS